MFPAEPDGAVTLSGSELLAALALAGLAAIGGLGYALIRTRRLLGAARRQAELGDGAVLIAEAGRIADASEPAARLLGAPLVGRSAREVLEAFLDCCRDAAMAALTRLEARGERFELIVGDRGGRYYALLGEPRGGLVRLVLREAALLDAELERVAADLAERERTAARREAEVEAVSGLLAAAPVALWARAADGSVSWSRGRIATAEGAVEAASAAALAAARPERAEGGTARFRLELGPGESVPEGDASRGDAFRGEQRADGQGGDEPGDGHDAAGPRIALEAIEVPAPGGGRYGLALEGSAALDAERTLARFLRTMTETFAHLNVGLAIFDQTQRLALFNPALVDMWQADPAWLARRPTLREILDGLRANRRIPESADFHAWRRRLTGLFDDTEAADYDELWHLADGSDIRVLAKPHPHGSLAFVFEDVTERLRLAKQFHHSIDLRRATLDRLEEGLAVFGPDGLLQFVNAAFHDIWGSDEESVRPLMHVREMIPLIGGQTVETEVWQRLVVFITGADSRQPWGARLTLGTGRILNARFAGLPDGSTMAVFGDVTDSERIAAALRERNEALEAAEEMRAAVLDQISHRLRTPLHTIFGFSQLLVDPRFGTLSETQQGYAGQILESARQLLGTVNDVTELAGLEIDPLLREDAEPSLGEMLLSIARLLEKRATEEGVTLRVALPERDEPVPACEPQRLRQIVFGLATAAIGGCREGTEVVLDARAGPGGTVEVRVGLSLRAPGPECPSLPFIRRLAAQCGGEIELRRVGDGADTGESEDIGDAKADRGSDREDKNPRAVALCRFPAAPVPAPAESAGSGRDG